MAKSTLDKQNTRNFAIVIWIIVALMMVLYCTPWFKISTLILNPLLLCALIIVSTIFYLSSSKEISNPKVLKKRSRIFVAISLVLFINMAFFLTIAIMELLRAPEQNKGIYIGYTILGLTPMLAILLTGAISFLTIFLKLRRRAK